MNLIEYIKSNAVFLDGGMGTLLQEKGLLAGELPERWNISHPEVIKDIHRMYYEAGSNIINTNTFGANTFKFSEEELEDVIKAALDIAKAARKESAKDNPKWIAFDIGPTGRLLKPYGDLDFEEAVSVFAKSVKLGVKYGADLILIETMNDSYETKAALLAAKENSDLPVFVTNAYGADGKLMTGADPSAMVAMLEGMGADAIGINCSLGPKELREVAESYLKYASVPVILKPNAGLPRSVNGRTVFDVLPEEFSREMLLLMEKGVRIVGGCCGTTPEYIKELTSLANGLIPQPTVKKDIACVSSYTHAVIFGETPILIGERINPTGKKKLKEALRAKDMDYILKEGIAQEERGAHILDVNVGLPEIDESEMLLRAVEELQAVCSLPLQIDTSDPVAMEKALRRYNGKAMINSVNGKKESMEAVFPLAKKYGGLVVALTLDENGIPSDAEGRLEIAKRIINTAQSYGIDKKDIIFDPLALTVSADKSAASETLRAIKLIKEELGCHTSLGVSNVSFGLPARDIINGAFFTLALGQGLSAAIMNPYSAEMMKAYRAFKALSGLDDNCAEYIEFTQNLPSAELNVNIQSSRQTAVTDNADTLQRAIVKGLKDDVAKLTAEMIKDTEPLEIVNKEIIPALNTVGEGFEKKTVYLPQLLMSAEAAKVAFEIIKVKAENGRAGERCAFVIATVKGDIHDIGKNIVKLILENYGFSVTDLGRDVAPETVAEAVVRLHAPLVGLSALMTTTVPAMEETIKLLREKAPWCRIVVGGAVLNEEYAASIGADKYAGDAMETVRYAESVEKTLR